MGDDGQVLDTLGAVNLVFRPAQGEVDALAFNRDFGHAQAVVKGIDAERQFERGNAVVGKPHAIGHHAHLGRAELQARQWAHLVAFAARKSGANQTGGALCRDHHFFKVGAGDIELDGTAATDVAAEQARLVEEAEGAGLPEQRSRQHRDQFGHPICRLRISAGAEESAAGQGDEEVVADLGRAVGFRLWPGHAAPKVTDAIFHPERDLGHGVEIIAWWRQHDAEDQVAIAFRQIFQLWQEVIAGEARASDDAPCHH